MGFGFAAGYQLPGIDTTLQTTENITWWGRFEQQLGMSALIDGTTRDAGNTPTDLLRPGLLMGRITATGKLKQWDPAQTDGTEHIFGVLLADQKMTMNSVDKDRWLGFVHVKGNLKAGAILIPGAASAGINGAANELLVRALLTMNGRFVLDDELQGSNFPWQRVVAKTADYTCVEADNNTLFTNEGASGAVIFTLPTMRLGWRASFLVVADQTVKLTAAPADTLIVFNDAAADTVSLETAGDKIGGSFDVLGLASGKAFVRPSLWGDGVLVQTITITT